jgi:fatty-acyl-CoA synthase
MGPLKRIAREVRFLDGLFRTLLSVRKISPDSDFLICDDFEEAVDKFADHTAMVFEGERYTYRQLDALANRFAAWADAQGLKHGDTVGLLLPNRAEYISAWVGLTKLGIAAALINNNLTGAALAHCLSISNADHVITDNEGLTAAETIRAGLPRPLKYWVIDADFPQAADRHALDLKEPKIAPERPPKARRAGLKARDVALYIYTSGTTGLPKAARRCTHIARADFICAASPAATAATAEDNIYQRAAALSRDRGAGAAFGPALLNGGTLVLRRSGSQPHISGATSSSHGGTMFVYIGELCRYLVNQDSSARTIGRTPAAPRLSATACDRTCGTSSRARFAMCRDILEFYGSTEGNVLDVQLRRPAGRDRPRAVVHQNRKVNDPRWCRFDVETDGAGARTRTGFASVLARRARSAKPSA